MWTGITNREEKEGLKRDSKEGMKRVHVWLEERFMITRTGTNMHGLRMLFAVDFPRRLHDARHDDDVSISSDDAVRPSDHVLLLHERHHSFVPNKRHTRSPPPFMQMMP